MTPYLRWREKNVSLYEQVYDAPGMARLKQVFPSIRKTMSRILGLHARDVRIRKISSVVAIYVPIGRWNDRRQDNISLNTKRDYSNYLHGALSLSRWWEK